MRGGSRALIAAVVIGVAVAGSVPAASAKAEKPSGVTVKVREFAVVPTVDHTSGRSVRFSVRNEGTEAHELVVARIGGSRPLTTDAVGAADEEAIAEADAMGEAEDIAPKRTKRFTVTGLTPGAYQLFCNIVEEEDGATVSHYAEGMHTVFVVL